MPNNKPRRFAEGTSVPAGKTRLEIEDLLKKNGASSFAYGDSNGVGKLMFEMRGRRILFKVALVDAQKQAAEHRRRWRALLLVLKGKLESISDTTIETFEEAFLAHTVTPDGRTVAEITLPQIADAVKSGRQPPLMLTSGPSSDSRY